MDNMEDKALRKGLSAAAIILIIICALVMSFDSTNGLLYGDRATLYGIPFIAAVAIPLLAVLIVLTRCCKSSDTVEETMAAIASRYARFESRRMAIEKINELFGTNVEVEYYDGLPTTLKEEQDGDIYESMDVESPILE